jgi:hypothetical protein
MLGILYPLLTTLNCTSSLRERIDKERDDAESVTKESHPDEFEENGNLSGGSAMLRAAEVRRHAQRGQLLDAGPARTRSLGLRDEPLPLAPDTRARWCARHWACVPGPWPRRVEDWRWKASVRAPPESWHSS